MSSLISFQFFISFTVVVGPVSDIGEQPWHLKQKGLNTWTWHSELHFPAGNSWPSHLSKD
jgi:hypothetical protein